ncbi:YheU family protein [Aestuariibacter halophilus]|uniref:YheU family protein n=1 Tax=Fluctibacter halophilus TaxID=226011 RepID=A0ABS8G949_9ALTE|nr:YheU family protein [Aestuariibacter halophilus]MCC2617038.1 YheU family protein [Aestuariibacter halophilus]
MRIPVEQLAADTLLNIVRDFVLREGTDYGESEVPLQTKVEQVVSALKRGEAVLLYSELHESVDIISIEAYRASQMTPPEQN